LKRTLPVAAIFLAAGSLYAQFDFKVAGRNVQLHSFASQGFAYSNDNNYLTMNTSSGSFALTDAGANISVQVNDKFRVGAQFYLRNVGNLGNFHPEVDWALGDYRFAPWFGIRVGKVKTTLGLYNDTQDLEFLHTWALLPQSAYPLDLRASTIAHTGGDFYGTIPVKKLGSLSYTMYGGSRIDDPRGGYYYGIKAVGAVAVNTNGNQIGGDLRWNTPLPGLLVGGSYLDSPLGAHITVEVAPTVVFPGSVSGAERTTVFYGEYKTGGLTLAGEYRRERLFGMESVPGILGEHFAWDERGWWASGAYRFSKRLELGSYYSRFFPSWADGDFDKPGNHLFDKTVTARLDLTTHWDLKIEGHFLDGYGSPTSFRGFYPQDNPTGFKPKTTMFLVRTGWNF